MPVSFGHKEARRQQRSLSFSLNKSLLCTFLGRSLFSFLLEIDNLGHFLFLHDFPMLDDTIVHFFFKPLVNLSALQPDLILGIFFDFSWAITFQMFDATAEATAPTFRIKPFGIVRTRLGQVSNLTTYKTLRKSERKRTSFQFHTEFLPNRNSFPPKRVF